MIPREGLQFHSSGGHGDRPIYHGLGGADRERGVDRERFQRAVARALVRVFAGDDTPLVLAADQVHQAAMAKEVGGAVRLAPQGVLGNPDHLAAHELHERAWPRRCCAASARRHAWSSSERATAARPRSASTTRCRRRSRGACVACGCRSRRGSRAASTASRRAQRPGATRISATSRPRSCSSTTLVLELGVDPGSPDGIAAELR